MWPPFDGSCGPIEYPHIRETNTSVSGSLARVPNWTTTMFISLICIYILTRFAMGGGHKLVTIGFEQIHDRSCSEQTISFCGSAFLTSAQIPRLVFIASSLSFYILFTHSLKLRKYRHLHQQRESCK